MKRTFLRIFMIPLIPTILVVIYIFLTYMGEGLNYVLSWFWEGNRFVQVFSKPVSGMFFLIGIGCVIGACWIIWWMSDGMLKYSEKKWKRYSRKWKYYKERIILRWKEKRDIRREARRRARMEEEARYIPPEQANEFIRFLREETRDTQTGESRTFRNADIDPESTYYQRIGLDEDETNNT